MLTENPKRKSKKQSKKILSLTTSCGQIVGKNSHSTTLTSTGLAIYKIHWDVSGAENGDELVPIAESGAFKFGVIAGAGFGDNATGVFTPSGMAQSPSPGNALSVYGANWYGPDVYAGVTAAPGVPNPMNVTFLEPSKEVPYVVVRDNVCLVYGQTEVAANDIIINARLECAQIGLDQSTLNQLLRTQTV